MEIPIIAQVAATAGILLTVVQYWMKTMIPLRIVGIITNVLFLIYAGISGIWPTVVLNCIVLPLNLYRVHEMRQLIRRTQRAARADLDMTWLQPFMTRRKTKKGQVIFRKGDIAEAMYLVVDRPLPLAGNQYPVEGGRGGGRTRPALARRRADGNPRIARRWRSAVAGLREIRRTLLSESGIRARFSQAHQQAAVRKYRAA